MPEHAQKVSAKDFFLHILSIITLYVSAGSFVALLFSYINILLPDPLRAIYYDLEGEYRTIRWSISSLIVVFPAYIFITKYLHNLYEKKPEKRNLRVRKWLVYFTLFLASLIIGGNLVTLIFNLLGGDTTLKFLLKVASVFFVAGSVFGYYFYDIKKHKTE